ncbi:MAG: Alternative oxidase/tellurite resistance protein TehB [Parcubacteria bacterium C7867-008]|nr:MAG: Alternative oxidase/tellurite resistance protein TehB [Parcubacteria bacterium C7867-008]
MRMLISRVKRIRVKIRTWIAYVGTGHHCPVCNRSMRSFMPSRVTAGQSVVDRYKIVSMGSRKQMQCPWCGASDKERLVYLYLKTHTDIFTSSSDVLHIAPEKNLMRLLRNRPTGTYIAGDKFEGDPRYLDGRYGDAISMDVTDLPSEDNNFDYIICNHVLEHVLDDARAMSEIYRVLKPGGLAILQVPVTRETKVSIEDANVSEPEDRIRVFGQADHVRIYAEAEYILRLTQAGFTVSSQTAKELFTNEECERFGLSLREAVYVARK